MNIIYYNGRYIRYDGDGHYTAFFYDEDGDLNELTTKDLDKAKRVIDEYPFDENGEPYSEAVKNIMSDTEGYLCMENIDCIDDDKEMPYDPQCDD